MRRNNLRRISLILLCTVLWKIISWGRQFIHEKLYDTDPSSDGNERLKLKGKATNMNNIWSRAYLNQ